MDTGARLALFAGLLGLTLWFPAAASADPVLRTQAPCLPGPNGFCLVFFSGEPPFTASEFSFKAGGAGTAMITFQGYLQCYSQNTISRTVVDVDAQIVMDKNAVADPHGPGGLKSVVIIEKSVDLVPGMSFNLASTRIIPILERGRIPVFFNIKPARMDAGTACRASNLAFSVLFLPN